MGKITDLSCRKNRGEPAYTWPLKRWLDWRLTLCIYIYWHLRWTIPLPLCKLQSPSNHVYAPLHNTEWVRTSINVERVSYMELPSHFHLIFNHRSIYEYCKWRVSGHLTSLVKYHQVKGDGKCMTWILYVSYTSHESHETRKIYNHFLHIHQWKPNAQKTARW